MTGGPPLEVQARVTRRRGSKPKVDRRPLRLGIVSGLLLMAGFGLSFRVALFQIADRAQLVAIAASERSGAAAIPDARGLIYDDAGNPLAVDDEVYEVFASPNEITLPEVEARTLAAILHEPTDRILTVLHSKAAYPLVARSVSQSVANRIDTSPGLVGISLQPVANRVYPEGTLGSQVLGFVDSHGGQYGVEQYYNPLLSGVTTRAELIQTAKFQGDAIRVRPWTPEARGFQYGATLQLTLDTYMQDVAEQDLRRNVLRFGASSGTVIISNPNTGRIIAMANYPWFNPNHYASSKPSTWTNAAILNTYEPGSTFKIITMAAGLNEHVITPRTSLFDPGYAVYPCVTVHNWDYPTVNGQETMTQVLQHSANVGAAFVANLLGVNRFYPYVQAFGVGSRTGIDLAGEGTGWVPLPHARNSNWTCGNLYTNAYGQSLTVTPLQLLAAANAVADGGWLMRPQVVKRIDYRGVLVYRRPQRIRRVISWRTAHTLTGMLVQSALGPPGQYGEASCALVPGYTIAAKTGTANLVGPGGGYLSGPGSTIASTVAYAPAFHPRFSVLVVIRRPRFPWPNAQWGSEVAAPLVHDILQSLFLRYHVPPTSSGGRVLESQTAFGGCNF